MKKFGKLLSFISSFIFTYFLYSFFDVAWAGAQTSTSSGKWPFLAAGISAGVSALAAGIAVAYTGSAAIGAMAEKPETAGRSIIFVGLAEGIAIYGLIIAIMILGKVK